MDIISLIIRIIALWILYNIAINQKIIARNQVNIGKILKEINNNIKK